MEIHVVFKIYRQVNGEYQAVQVETAFAKKEDAESFLKGKQLTWYETRDVPLNSGGTMPIEFQGWFVINSTELHGI